MIDWEKQEIISLLRASINCVEEGTCDAVLYQTMGALHQYTSMCAGIQMHNLSQDGNRIAKQHHQPAFVLPQKKSLYGTPGNEIVSDHEDALAYGWVEELSSTNSDDSSSVAWNSVLALLVQKEHDDEPCLWITKEVLARGHHFDKGEYDDNEYQDNRNENDNAAATELETLHSIQLKRGLRSCHYQNFYGDHRVVLQLKHRVVQTAVGRQSPRKGIHIAPFQTSAQLQQIVLRCPSAGAATAWVDCLSKAKRHKLPTDVIEMEMANQSPSNDFTENDGDGNEGWNKRHHIVNVVDSDDVNEKHGIDTATTTTTTTRLAEEFQDSEDRKRSLKLAVKQAAALERVRQHQQEKEEARQRELEATRETETHEKEKLEAKKKVAIERKEEEDLQQKRTAAIEKNVERIAKATTVTTPAKLPAKAATPKPMTAAEKQQQRMEREIAARKRAEDERARIEIEYEQKKKERVEQRRRDLEAQRKAAREQQRKKELLQKQKFLESEQKKEAMKASAMKAVPKKAVKGIFSTQTVGVNDTSKDPKATSGAKDYNKGSLWYSLDKQMSAFEANDEERKRKDAERQEEEKAKAKAEQEEVDPEFIRKRIAEEARQRLVQEEVGKRTKETEALKKKQADSAKLGGALRQPNNQQQGATSPLYSNSPTTSQHEQIPQPSVSPTAPAHQQHHNSAANSMPSVPPLHHPHTQSWNKMHQPPYPPRQTHFQRSQQPTGSPYHQSGSPAQVYRQQQPNPVPPYPTHLRQHQQQQQQPYPQSAPVPTHPHSANPTQHETDEESSESALTKKLLIQWGLQPPSMQVLKPVDELLCSIDGVFPPSFGVPSHDYFQGWKPISHSELVSSTGALEETKLKKLVRKVRFFLHPDKLPHDLTEDQSFLCKLLWDVINDAFEEYKKSKEDLDWM